MRRTIRIAVAGAAFLLAACGGGGGGSQGPAPIPAPVSATPAPQLPAASGKVAFTVVVPGSSSASTARAPRYVSPSTASLTVSLQNTAPTQPTLLATVNLTPGSPNCTTFAAGLSCTVTAGAPVGTDTLIVTTWDALNGTGHQLSSATITATIQQNATNVVPLTLGGSPVSASLILGTSSIAVGAPAQVSITVVAYDAQNNMIVGPGLYSTPVTVLDSDTTGATSLQTSGTAPVTNTIVTGPGTSLTISYNGNSFNGATLTPVVNSNPGTPVTLTATGYAFASYVLPSNDFEDINTLAPGPDGNVWYGSYGIIGKMTTHGSATEYAGNQNVPYASINALAAGSDGNMWFGDQYGDVGSISTSGTVTLASSLATPTGCGNSVKAKLRRPATARRPQAQRRPQVTQSPPPSSGTPACGQVNWMTVGPDGNVWFSDDGGLIGNVTPAGAMTEWDITQLAGWQTGASTSEPLTIAFGKDGNLYAADYAYNNGGYVDQIVISGSTPTAVNQLQMANVPQQTSCAPNSVATTADGNVWFVTNCEVIGVVPQSSFSAASAFAWNIAGQSDGYSLHSLLATPGGLWATDDEYGTYRFTNLAAVSASVSPAITPLFPFGNQRQYPYAMCLGPDGNVWVSEDNETPDAVAKIIYGTPGTGSQSITRTLPKATLRR